MTNIQLYFETYITEFILKLILVKVEKNEKFYTYDLKFEWIHRV